MQWWLNVFFLVNGLWVPGQEFDGWAPRPYASERLCFERKTFAERESRLHPLDHPAVWICSEGEPMREPPDDMRGRSC
ncbi:hypothetical protein [Lutibaculum baratangense]|uniref:Uncharacterized protein n=1 Tax=Lutibaculum baratangense AMV1 TaxID=631454 RepID=V4TCP6_9HYPH|nr:hypothetical protein [Lutibaculum baratangense]ESR24073.1 hypothetical protein N177_2522 [Lutibaculum baratangense AMV1]